MASSPLVIVGIGGSGTRVFARLAEASGRHMGWSQNDSNDALTLYGLADKWCEPVHLAWEERSSLDQTAFESDLALSLAAHRQGAAETDPWGWKQPRSIHLLPALAAALPELLLLHVVRDGRDVALGNGIHLRLTGSYTVPDLLRAQHPRVQLAHIWGAVNIRAADFGERVLGRRYLRISLEELCENPVDTTGRILEVCGGRVPREQVERIVQAPESIGRWRRADPALVAEIAEAARPALHRFGYSD